MSRPRRNRVEKHPSGLCVLQMDEEGLWFKWWCATCHGSGGKRVPRHHRVRHWHIAPHWEAHWNSEAHRHEARTRELVDNLVAAMERAG